jgi:hypothetical protein
MGRVKYSLDSRGAAITGGVSSARSGSWAGTSGESSEQGCGFLRHV